MINQAIPGEQRENTSDSQWTMQDKCFFIHYLCQRVHLCRDAKLWRRKILRLYFSRSPQDILACQLSFAVLFGMFFKTASIMLHGMCCYRPDNCSPRISAVNGNICGKGRPLCLPSVSSTNSRKSSSLHEIVTADLSSYLSDCIYLHLPTIPERTLNALPDKETYVLGEARNEQFLQSSTWEFLSWRAALNPWISDEFHIWDRDCSLTSPIMYLPS